MGEEGGGQSNGQALGFMRRRPHPVVRLEYTKVVFKGFGSIYKAAEIGVHIERVRLPSEFAELASAAALLAIATVLFVTLARQDWPGISHPCLAQADCYCEAARAGWLRQPANTWSCLAGVFVGLAIAAHSSTSRRSGRVDQARNRMQAGGFYPALYACIVVYSGIGAAFFHASLTDWGGKLDMASMVLSFGFWLAYNVTRVFGLTKTQFLASFLGLTAVLLVPRVAFNVLGFEIFAGLVGAVLLSEILVARSPLRVQRSWLWVSLALYPPALGVWWLSLSGHLLCEPASLLQGHALWHVITALSPGALYFYFWIGERAPTERPDPSLTP